MMMMMTGNLGLRRFSVGIGKKAQVAARAHPVAPSSHEQESVLDKFRFRRATQYIDFILFNAMIGLRLTTKYCGQMQVPKKSDLF